MNVVFFHLMPYGELPSDFRERHPSIWADIDSRLFDPEGGGAMYNDYLDELEDAARLGFDGVCVNEHHANGYGMMPSPNLMASILARTRQGAIGVMGNAAALYDPPTRVAEEMAMLDCISGGRLVAGLGGAADRGAEHPRRGAGAPAVPARGGNRGYPAGVQLRRRRPARRRRPLFPVVGWSRT